MFSGEDIVVVDGHGAQLANVLEVNTKRRLIWIAAELPAPGMRPSAIATEIEETGRRQGIDATVSRRTSGQVVYEGRLDFA